MILGMVFVMSWARVQRVRRGSIYSSIGIVLDFNLERLQVRSPLREKLSKNLNVTIRAMN